ncbi:putative toxin-antitoxin system antitoxin component, TIGR02293 family [Sphingomonas laterariae]|uniref:Putative toxin-antitoxin system antitoxin component, TIGR02293 family n=1 Tax=Edaphosphingomonas laterariae TaxID=861865 RepID=A0A239E037_9SPHN|nr:antitoxin Xre/MbcA/ParS toxin-binding domain-containing protein [Sphingomonas laterariae]SNS37879.1 putative toxin-antitoxin system antitoxin component, TIGR02293 family [Sphingomonas laterariae]
MATAFSLDRFLHAPPLDRARVVESGLPAKAVRDLVADPAITLADIARIVAKRRTLERRLADDEALTPEESDRFARFAEVLELAADILGGRATAMEWLRAPKARFEGMSPLDLLRTHAGAQLVENLLLQARHGMLG